jgi:hypothetical protein
VTFPFVGKPEPRQVGIHEVDVGVWMTMRQCSHCTGRGHCYEWRGGPCKEPDWCCDCGGGGQHYIPHLPPGATQRLAAALRFALADHGVLL